MPVTLPRRFAAEFVGTAFLLATVVGSGIMAETLSQGSPALALLANSVATGAGLIALILTFGPVSGAHLNPAVTLSSAITGGLPWREVPTYVSAQVTGAFVGVATAHAMFGEALFRASTHVRAGGAQAFSEAVATFGLLAVILYRFETAAPEKECPTCGRTVKLYEALCTRCGTELNPGYTEEASPAVHGPEPA